MRGMKVWVILALFLGCTACPSDESGKADKDNGETQPVDRVETPPDMGEALAMVNGLPITQEEFLIYIEPYPNRMKENLQGREYVLNALTDQILLEGEAKRMGLDRDADYVRKVDSYRRNLLNNMLFEAMNQGEFQVTPQEAQEYFQSHPEEFDRPERVHIRHILLASEAEAKQVLKKIKKGGSFEQLARELSIDASTRNRGGDLGPFSREQRPELATAAFSIAKTSGIAGPVKTGRGYHLLQLVRRIPAKKESYEQIRDSLMSRLRARKRQDVKKQLLEKLRESAQIQVEKQALESLQVPMGAK
jgi:peptidyl-prolyl cis-trans isomerase C